MEQLLFRRREVAAMLGVSVSQILRWEQLGLLKPLVLALPDDPRASIRAVRYSREDVQALAARFVSAADGR